MAESQIIEVPGVGQVEFPSSMSDADIVTAVKKLHLDSQIPNPKQFEKNVPGDAEDPVLHPKPILGQKVADMLNKPLLDVPVVGPMTSPGSLMLMGAGAAANGVGKGPVSSGLKSTGKALSTYHPFSRPLEPIGDLMTHVGEKMAQPPRPVFGSGGVAPTERGPIPQSGGPITVPTRPVFGSGGVAPMDRGPIPTSGGPINIAPKPQQPNLIGSDGTLPMDRGPIPEGGGPIRIPAPTGAPLQTPTAMSPRLVGKAPAVNDALLDAIKEVQARQEPAKTTTLAPTPGSEMTPATGKHDPVGKMVKVGTTSGNPSKTAEQMGGEPPTTVSETVGEQPDYVKQMMGILEGQTETPKPRSALSDMTSKTSRERSPLSLNDQERIWLLLTEEQKIELKKLRAEGQQGHTIHDILDATARSAAEREQ